MRSFLRHNGYNRLPKADLQYVFQAWHRGYKRPEIQNLLGLLKQKVHRLFVAMAAESGLRSHVLMALRYGHVREDLETETIPIAIRLEPRFYLGKKAAGYTFLGAGAVKLLRGCIEEGLIEARPESRLIQKSYYGMWAAIHRAKKRAGLDPKIQSCHGFRKYFENALDDANIDHEKKMIIEGHFAGTRARHYTERDIEQLRDVYRRSYPFIEVEPVANQPARVEETDLKNRLAQVVTLMSRQRVLEAKLTVLEEQLNGFMQVLKKSEGRFLQMTGSKAQ